MNLCIMLFRVFCSITKFNALSANPTKWSNTLKQFVGNLPTNCLSVFDHFVKLALKRLRLRFTLFLIKAAVSVYHKPRLTSVNEIQCIDANW